MRRAICGGAAPSTAVPERARQSGRRTYVCGAQAWPRTPPTRVRLALPAIGPRLAAEPFCIAASRVSPTGCLERATAPAVRPEAGSHRSPVVGPHLQGRAQPSGARQVRVRIADCLLASRLPDGRCREVLRRSSRVAPVGRHRHRCGEPARLLALGRYGARGHARPVRGPCHLPPDARARRRRSRRLAACAGRMPVRTCDEHALPRRLLRPLRGAQVSVRGRDL